MEIQILDTVRLPSGETGLVIGFGEGTAFLSLYDGGVAEFRLSVLTLCEFGTPVMDMKV